MARSSSTHQPLPAADEATPPVLPPRLFAGTSGWAYPTWKPGFYPAGLAAKKFLPYYATRLNAVEVNYTFRMLPSAAMLQGWLDATPAYFRFSFKAPQRITHFARLRNCDALVSDFVAALAPARLAGKLGPLLFQLPPNFKAAPDLLAGFLAHPALAHAPIAFEFRHESWFAEETYAILRAHNAALCIAESDTLATPEVHTAATHACLRLRHSGGYSPAELEGLAVKLTALAATREVYAFFKHEDDPTGALNAVDFLAACATGVGKR